MLPTPMGNTCRTQKNKTQPGYIPKPKPQTLSLSRLTPGAWNLCARDDAAEELLVLFSRSVEGR